LKILEIWIMSLVFFWRRGRDAHAYYLTHTESGTLCPAARKCRIIQALSWAPQCLVKRNFVFLTIIDIKLWGMPLQST
jgi:hypothetical protein